MHSTENLNDGYFGSSLIVKRSIKKYGKENHRKEIIDFCSSRQELEKRERDLVTEDLLKDKLCMNLVLGGNGGWNFVNKNSLCPITNKKLFNQLPKEIRDRIQLIRIEQGKKLGKWVQDHPEHDRKWRGKKHKPETISLMKQKAAGRAIGKNNGSYGSKWIYNEDSKENKRVYSEEVKEYIDSGWKLGRKVRFNGK